MAKPVPWRPLVGSHSRCYLPASYASPPDGLSAGTGATVVSNGRLSILDEPGLGVTVDVAALGDPTTSCADAITLTFARSSSRSKLGLHFLRPRRRRGAMPFGGGGGVAGVRFGVVGVIY